MNPTNDSAERCPVCGGPAHEGEVSIDFWRGGVELEPITVVACEDPGCDAYYPATRRHL